ncbi:MAG TPA: 2'-5' RNA ligase family protein [Acidimicrobiales bacterium]|nr:2'-5' RNA ligase family protein [Acidimicrobiales bacterium]
MRLFVAVRPPGEVVEALAAVPRPVSDAVRWTGAGQWHVTLRFFGEVDDATPITSTLNGALLDAQPVVVRIGPRATTLGRGVVCLPVDGLRDLAGRIAEATRDHGARPPARAFHGHLTLARTKGRRPPIDGFALDASWTVGEVELVRSHLGGGPARYEPLATFVLGGG